MTTPPTAERAPALRLAGTALEHLAPRIRVDDNGCWIWEGRRSGKGYGCIEMDGKRRLLHRVVYEALVAPIPRHLDSDHLCRVKLCINPAHIEPVPRVVNATRGAAAKLTPAIVRSIHTDPRSCPTLAKVYGVTRFTIRNVRRGISWKHVSDNGEAE